MDSFCGFFGQGEIHQTKKKKKKEKRNQTKGQKPNTTTLILSLTVLPIQTVIMSCAQLNSNSLFFAQLNQSPFKAGRLLFNLHKELGIFLDDCLNTWNCTAS